jgi:hypothetical protein
VFTVQALSKVATWLVTETAIGRARAVSVTLASWWAEATYKSTTSYISNIGLPFSKLKPELSNEARAETPFSPQE